MLPLQSFSMTLVSSDILQIIEDVHVKRAGVLQF